MREKYAARHCAEQNSCAASIPAEDVSVVSACAEVAATGRAGCVAIPAARAAPRLGAEAAARTPQRRTHVLAPGHQAARLAPAFQVRR